MENWGEDNFANDGARDYLAVLTTKLVATIQSVCADEQRMQPDEDGEALLMPSVEVLALLCERYNAKPPKPATVRQWHERYLKAYDDNIDRLAPNPAFKTGRRKVIERTFLWLESLATTFWDQ